MVGFTGATATDTTAGGAGLTVTGTVAETVGAKTLVAVMLAVPTATPLIVPEVLTETIDGSDDVQVTAVEAPPTAVTVAAFDAPGKDPSWAPIATIGAVLVYWLLRKRRDAY